MSSWLNRPETSKADEEDVSIRETESTPQLVDVNSFNNSRPTNEENSDTTKDRSDASNNDYFPTIIVNSEIKKAIITAGPKQPERPFPKDPCHRLCFGNPKGPVEQGNLNTCAETKLCLILFYSGSRSSLL